MIRECIKISSFILKTKMLMLLRVMPSQRLAKQNTSSVELISKPEKLSEKNEHTSTIKL